MDREAERILLPFTTMDDIAEKGLRHSPTTESTTSSTHSVVIGGTRIRFRILGIIAITVIPVFAILFVMLLSVILLYTIIPIPDFHFGGDITGVVNATLGTFGHAVIYPDVNLKLKLML